MAGGGDSRSGDEVEAFPVDRTDENVREDMGTGARVAHLGTISIFIGTGQHRVGAMVTAAVTVSTGHCGAIHLASARPALLTATL